MQKNMCLYVCMYVYVCNFQPSSQTNLVIMVTNIYYFIQNSTSLSINKSMQHHLFSPGVTKKNFPRYMLTIYLVLMLIKKQFDILFISNHVNLQFIQILSQDLFFSISSLSHHTRFFKALISLFYKSSKETSRSLPWFVLLF